MNDRELKTRLCEILGSIPGFEWDPAEDAEYSPGSVGVFFGGIRDAPDQAVGVRLYGGNHDPNLKTRKAQIWVRGGRRELGSADDIADAVLARFDGLSREGGILGIRRESMSDQGSDDNDRDLRSENYTITLDNEEALP